MATRKNAKSLTAAEKQKLVRALVMMKADPVPGRPYNWYDAFVLIHRYIQNVNAPAVAGGSPARNNVNFGHQGAAFCPWHRYFLFRFEQQLQNYVPGVMLPYWDWTDPALGIMVPGFMGPNGVMANNWQVRQGYFAGTAPGSGGNMTSSPAWWPAGLAGWTLPAAWGTYAGPLRRTIKALSFLPTADAIRQTLDMPSYSSFRPNLEAGSAVPGTMHNSIHGWFGPNSHMVLAKTSPFDPMFFLHHANIDRLWAMWQMDGHGNDYPPDGSVTGHHRLNDPMYPWVGAAPGYSANDPLPGLPQLPDFSTVPAVTAADVMDHRALGYSYDCMVTVGIALDRSGSMLGQTPDPMTGMGDVSKWEAAKRGVSAFLQDCEAAYQSNEAYVCAGIKTFRAPPIQLLPVFAGSPFGVIKAAGGYNAAAFDSAIVAQTVSSDDGTPIVAALNDAFSRLVQAPFAGAPATERRYLAVFTDGVMPSTGLAAMPNASLARTAVCAMGFGHPGEVNYSALASIVAKGAETLPTPQVFHGENAGQIDKFFSRLLADALGYSPVMDPALELFAGEHVHLAFTGTSAEAAFYITAQGADFDDEAWSYQLMGPDGTMLYADGALPLDDHDGGHAHDQPDGCHCMPHVSARRSNGRLSLFVQRNNCDASMWTGDWMLLVARRARDFESMVMISPGPLLFPVAAGPIRGPRYARLLQRPSEREPARNIEGAASNDLDETINSTNRSCDPCTVVVNVHARTGLRFDLVTDGVLAGEPLLVELSADVTSGTAAVLQSAVRAVSPRIDLRALLPEPRYPDDADDEANSTQLLARLEAKDPERFVLRDEAATLASHHEGDWHFHQSNTSVPGAYHFGVMVSGIYRPEAGSGESHPHDHAAPEHMEHGDDEAGHAGRPARCGERTERVEYFSRILSVSAGLTGKSSP
jgi:hypothetical protein